MKLWEEDLRAIHVWLQRNKVDTLVTWGLLSHLHTHYFIHAAVDACFRFVAATAPADQPLRVFYLDDDEASANAPGLMEGSGRLFFCSPHQGFDKHLPMDLERSFYLAHFRVTNFYTGQRVTKFDPLFPKRRALRFNEFRRVAARDNAKDALELKPPHQYFVPSRRELVTLWATHLLPPEVEANMSLVSERWAEMPEDPKRVFFMGTVWHKNRHEIGYLKHACSENGWTLQMENTDDEAEHQRLLQAAAVAPAIQGKGHITSWEEHYIPCRVFKNASMGQPVVTNNLGVQRVFDGERHQVHHDADIAEAIRKGLSVDRADGKEKEKMLRTMEHVRDHHTYVARFALALRFLGQ